MCGTARRKFPVLVNEIGQFVKQPFGQLGQRRNVAAMTTRLSGRANAPAINDSRR
jgi:hypothetical protein